MNKGNLFGYLGNFVKGGESTSLSNTKTNGTGGGVTVKAHVRAPRGSGGRLSPSYSGGPEGKPNPAMVSPAKHKDLKETEAGKATEASQALSGTKRNTRKGATANIEGNESAKYEKMEKRTLKSLKGGGTEKELREGHNVGMKATMGEFASGKLHSGSKKGPVVKSRRQAIAIGLSEMRKAGMPVKAKKKKAK